jgi:hypothetical protein
MRFQFIATCVFGAAAVVASVSANANAQVSSSAQSNSATSVAAEMSKGKLSPAASKPGDTVLLRLKNDLKSNGSVVLKRGTIITGVVRDVKRADANAQSMMLIEWVAPSAQGKTAKSLSVALQSVMQVNPIFRHEQESAASSDFGLPAVDSPSQPPARPTAGRNSAPNGGLLGGKVNGVVGTASTVTTGTVGAVGTANSAGSSNVALLSMPTVVAVDNQTTSAIESSLNTASSGQLFRLGHGQLTTASGSQQSLDLFSHLNNDTVITSANKDFEISSGAQMQLLVGITRK